ncbi:ABC transporter ATP-binding protein [Aliamphritea hakodatensis]|uniref:ABC transporter ATP-binding protein n=1 Tax=Aliamphritea hakodatensis TaxID=2895352 RepID=UPI0022FDA1CC|nr:ABC transporter ATP-binding protein [Aliamphritea hakodatensis]
MENNPVKTALTLSCSQLSFAYQQRQILQDISLQFSPGQFIGLIGPNGAGKSTLLKLLMGLLPAASGEVRLNDKPLSEYPRRDIARHISLVPQDVSTGYGFSVEEIVAMGRTPHLGAFQPESDQDLQRINDALDKTGLTAMRNRRADQLSGGERQRVFIARALAQEAPVLLLDEPTASLDVCHQLDVLSLVRELTEEGHLAIAAIHDMDMASRFCHRLLLLSGGSIVADGAPDTVITEANMLTHFGIRSQIENSPYGIRVTALASTSKDLL